MWPQKYVGFIINMSYNVYFVHRQLGSGYKARPETSKGNVVVWLPLVWLKPTLLLSGSPSSELLSWNPMADKPSPRLVHDEHLRGLACIAAQRKLVQK